MIKNSETKLDLDQLLIIAEKNGCACGLRPCLVHYADGKRTQEKLTNRVETYRSESKNSAQPDSRSPAVDSQGRGRRSDTVVRSDRPGNRDRSAKPVRNGSARKR